MDLPPRSPRLRRPRVNPTLSKVRQAHNDSVDGDQREGGLSGGPDIVIRCKVPTCSRMNSGSIEFAAGSVETTQGIFEVLLCVHGGYETTHTGQYVLPLFH